jgi:hypothetical protein
MELREQELNGAINKPGINKKMNLTSNKLFDSRVIKA